MGTPIRAAAPASSDGAANPSSTSRIRRRWPGRPCPQPHSGESRMVAALLVLTAAALSAQQPGDSARVLGAHRLAAGEQAPVVDGRLNDAVWAAAPVAGDFV